MKKGDIVVEKLEFRQNPSLAAKYIMDIKTVSYCDEEIELAFLACPERKDSLFDIVPLDYVKKNYEVSLHKLSK